MACTLCGNNLFKEKLGRCRSCMLLNFIVLVVSAISWFILYQSSPKTVETIALLLTFIASALLMTAHLGAYIYYRNKRRRKSKQDKSPLK